VQHYVLRWKRYVCPAIWWFVLFPLRDNYQLLFRTNWWYAWHTYIIFCQPQKKH